MSLPVSNHSVSVSVILWLTNTIVLFPASSPLSTSPCFGTSLLIIYPFPLWAFRSSAPTTRLHYGCSKREFTKILPLSTLPSLLPWQRQDWGGVRYQEILEPDTSSLSDGVLFGLCGRKKKLNNNQARDVTQLLLPTTQSMIPSTAKVKHDVHAYDPSKKHLGGGGKRIRSWRLSYMRHKGWGDNPWLSIMMGPSYPIFSAVRAQAFDTFIPSYRSILKSPQCWWELTHTMLHRHNMSFVHAKGTSNFSMRFYP